MQNDEPRPDPPPAVTDHPAPLGELTEIFDRRKFAVGLDSAGQIVLARPDTVLAKIDGVANRDSLARYVARFDEKLAGQIRGIKEDALPPFVTVRLRDVEHEQINGEGRWTLGRVEAVRRDLAALDPPVRAELNYVLFGEQVVKGNPLGAPATWAGEMAFVGNVATTKADDKGVKHKVLLSTAEPAEQPRDFRRRLNLDDRRRPQILVLDTGLRTVSDQRSGVLRPEHDFLECCIVHDGWKNPGPGADGRFPVDDEDEPDDDRTQDSRLRGGPRHVHLRRHRPALPRRRSAHVGGAVELRGR